MHTFKDSIWRKIWKFLYTSPALALATFFRQRTVGATFVKKKTLGAAGCCGGGFCRNGRGTPWPAPSPPAESKAHWLEPMDATRARSKATGERRYEHERRRRSLRRQSAAFVAVVWSAGHLLFSVVNAGSRLGQYCTVCTFLCIDWTPWTPDASKRIQSSPPMNTY